MITSRIQYHDSYKFSAKSYHSMQYHFKSIDTWLKGICRSHCPEHSWTRSKYQPGKKSIFAEDQANETADQDAEEDQEIDEQVNVCGDGNRFQCDASSDKGLERVGQLVSAEKQNIIRNPLQDCSTSVEEFSCKNGHPATDVSSLLGTSQYRQKTCHNLDECVAWLISKITIELEKEVSDEGDTSGLKLTDSSNVVDKDFKQEPVRNSCRCPQCCHITINCIHQDKTNDHNNQFKDEEQFERLEDSKYISSSLECFDFVYNDASDSQAVSIIQCPNNSTSGSSNARHSVSPSKAVRKGKGELKNFDAVSSILYKLPGLSLWARSLATFIANKRIIEAKELPNHSILHPTSYCIYIHPLEILVTVLTDYFEKFMQFS